MSGGGGGSRSNRSRTTTSKRPASVSGGGGLSSDIGSTSSPAICRNIRETTRLRNIPAATSFTIGEVLSVNLNAGGAGSLLIYRASSLVGVILPPSAQKIIECIKAGENFAAEVVKAESIIVDVQIYARI